MRASGQDPPGAVLDLLRRGSVVYAGRSAEACILSPTLHGLVGDPKDTETA
ncbi:hypothetical protein [Embleya sp. NPDC005575]|uniref:hypothetical protein n=1 Tax=Embleya sp. NPDC005575 TaxID=3156892 RepID=UPI0033B12E1A